MVKAGELGGVLEVVLNRLAEFMEKAQKIKGKVIAAMFYPVAVLVVAVHPGHPDGVGGSEVPGSVRGHVAKARSCRPSPGWSWASATPVKDHFVITAGRRWRSC